jgi:hypothetical protein
MPAMKKGVIALLVVATGLSACASESTGGHGASRAAAARADAGRALASVQRLHGQIARLRHRLTVAHATQAAVRKRLARLSGGLWGAVEKLKSSLHDVQSQVSAAAGAQSSASDALATAVQTSKDLSVLQQRFDYHLRHSGGG